MISDSYEEFQMRRARKISKADEFSAAAMFLFFSTTNFFFLVSESKKFMPIQHLDLELVNWSPVGCLETLTVVNAIDKVPVLYRRLTDVLIGSPR